MKKPSEIFEGPNSSLRRTFDSVTTPMEEQVEIVEYWNKEDKVYEMMLTSEFDKRQAGLPYEVFVKDTIAPFVIAKDRPDIKWVAQKRQEISSSSVSKEEELINRYMQEFNYIELSESHKERVNFLLKIRREAIAGVTKQIEEFAHKEMKDGNWAYEKLLILLSHLTQE